MEEQDDLALCDAARGRIVSDVSVMRTHVQRTTAQRLLRWTWIVGVATIAGYLVNVAAAMISENSLIYFPAVYPEGHWYPKGLAVEDTWFLSSDGTKLHGWYLPKENAVAAVLFCHGNGGNLTHRADSLQMLHSKSDVSVFIFDYRGYGRSEGSPNEAALYADARAARNWMAARENIPISEVVVMGESLGGAVAVDLAARDGARALILESTFSSLPDVAAYHYRWLPVRWLMRSRFDSIDKIANYHGPLLAAHGDIDTIVPFECGRRLFDVANQPKEFIFLRGHDHNMPMPTSFYESIRRFLIAHGPKTVDRMPPLKDYGY
jgi:fermentation-respiration switch protein FrsA (DUF1100 family)